MKAFEIDIQIVSLIRFSDCIKLNIVAKNVNSSKISGRSNSALDSISQ